MDATKGRLYLEFGGKLFDDYHAARVLPGFDPLAKVKLLQNLSGMTEIIFCINACHIEKTKLRADTGILYEQDMLRQIDSLRAMGLNVSSVVITQYDGQPSADMLRKQLQMRNENVFIHRHTSGYPTDVATIVSEEGYGANPYIPCSSPLVVVTAPGPGSGKLATCLSQLYHESRRGETGGYAKFETFPVWDLPLKHPVNLAYEAATADLDDVNMIDPFHLELYGKTTVNYNRDIEVFPILRTILSRITGADSVYKSPTEMGVNMIGSCITDHEGVKSAARQEILRRYYHIRRDHKQGRLEQSAVNKIELIMSQLELKTEDRLVVAPALKKGRESGSPAMAIILPDGQSVAGRGTELMRAPAGAIINAVKSVASIPDSMHLISRLALEPIIMLKSRNYNVRDTSLNLEEVLIALSISAVTNPTAELALNRLEELRGCEAHATYILPETDEDILRKLGINVTCEAMYSGQNLFNE
jgi:uncharacterized protein (UPF0371 family)